MPYKRRREYGKQQNFTPDEAQTATLIYTEGYPTCHRSDYKVYPAIIIKMCTRKSLEPAERVFGTKIGKSKSRKIICSPKDFPPDGKGAWRIRKRCKEEYGVKL